MLSGKCLGDAEAADASADDHAVDRGGAGMGLRGGFGRRCGGLLRNGAAENMVGVSAGEFSIG